MYIGYNIIYLPYAYSIKWKFTYSLCIIKISLRILIWIDKHLFSVIWQQLCKVRYIESLTDIYLIVAVYQEKWFFLSLSRCSFASDVLVAAVLFSSSTTTIGTTLQSHTKLNSRKQYLNDPTHVRNNNDDTFVLLAFKTIITNT